MMLMQTKNFQCGNLSCPVINHYHPNLTINNVINIGKGEFYGHTTSRTTFKTYCLRALGSGVIDINVSDDQVDDRIDEHFNIFQSTITMDMRGCISNI